MADYPCCFVGCERNAEFQIWGEHPYPDNDTLACEEHVGSLLGTPVGYPEQQSWTVIVFSVGEG